jgi:hypothetical protein
MDHSALQWPFSRRNAHESSNLDLCEPYSATKYKCRKTLRGLTLHCEASGIVHDSRGFDWVTIPEVAAASFILGNGAYMLLLQEAVLYDAVVDNPKVFTTY